MDNQELEVIQQQIGYRFKNTDLLQQAFVRRSYSQENGGEDNEVLEFIGDKVLDLIVVKLLAERYGYMLGDCDDFDPEQECDEFACDRNEAELTEIKRQLVQKKNLAHRIDYLGLADYLITGNGDHSWNEASVKEDLFEAIIGAAAIDCNWNLSELENLVDTMLCPDDLLEDPEDNYIAMIQDWTAKNGIGTPLYSFEDCGCSSRYGSGIYTYPIASLLDPAYKNFPCHCQMKISNNLQPFYGHGHSKTEARYNACVVAYEYLEKNNLLFSIRDEIPCPSKEDAIGQLETLSRRGYFSIPTYQFSQDYNRNGDPIWYCTCRIKEWHRMFEATSSSKKAAKKKAAYAMLTAILDNGGI